MISLMSLSAEATEVVSERANVAGNWGLIGSTVVTGIVIVFLILAILIFFLWAMGKIFMSIENSKKKRLKRRLPKLLPLLPHPLNSLLRMRFMKKLTRTMKKSSLSSPPLSLPMAKQRASSTEFPALKSVKNHSVQAGAQQVLLKTCAASKNNERTKTICFRYFSIQ